jgi:hypothetical protein
MSQITSERIRVELTEDVKLLSGQYREGDTISLPRVKRRSCVKADGESLPTGSSRPAIGSSCALLLQLRTGLQHDERRRLRHVRGSGGRAPVFETFRDRYPWRSSPSVPVTVYKSPPADSSSRYGCQTARAQNSARDASATGPRRSPSSSATITAAPGAPVTSSSTTKHAFGIPTRPVSSNSRTDGCSPTFAPSRQPTDGSSP